MEPAEELVNVWYHQRGYFTLTGLKIGNYQVDILAHHPVDGTGFHIEVQASTDPMGRLRPWKSARYSAKPLEWRVRALCNKKFVGATDKNTGDATSEKTRETVIRLLGTAGYGKVFVLAQFKGDSFGEIRDEFGKHGVEVILLKTILKDLVERTAKGVYMDTPRRYLQLITRNVLSTRSS